MEYKFSIFFAATTANAKDDTTIDSFGLLCPYSDHLFTVQEIPVLQPGNLTLRFLFHTAPASILRQDLITAAKIGYVIRSNLIGQ